MKVSIIMSTYKEYESGALKRAVSSVLRQTYKNWELIIVGDKTPFFNEINHLLKNINDTRLTFFNLDKRAGTASPGTVPKIKGIERSTGNLLCFLDADNLFFPKHLEVCVNAFKNDSALDLVYGDTLIECNKLSFFKETLAYLWKKPEMDKKREKMLNISNFLDMSEPIFTKKAYLASGGLNTSHHASDWLLWKAMIKFRAKNFKHIPHLGLVYHTSSLTHHAQYFILMIMQKLKITYRSDKLGWVQKSIVRRFKKKHS